MTDSAHVQAVHFVNKSGETMPARACGKLQTVQSARDPLGNPRFEVIKPDSSSGPWIVNGDCPVPHNGAGMGFLLKDATKVLAKAQEGESDLALGDKIGPTEGIWEATRDGQGLIVLDDADHAGNATVFAQPAVDAVAGSIGSCGCYCIEQGDINVSGIETTSEWGVLIGPVTVEVPNGRVTLPYGNYYMRWDNADGYWSDDVGSVLTAEYSDGTDATGAATLEGLLIFTHNEGGRMRVKLQVTATIPAP